MIGGIYCEIPLRRFYDRSVFYSVRWRLHKLIGGNVKFLDEEAFDSAILETLNKIIRKHFRQRQHPGYKDQTEQLKNSYGYAVYNLDKSHQPVLRQQPSFASDMTGLFEEFVDTYEPLTTNGWMVLLCATAPYAARVEASGEYDEDPNFKGYNKKVLLHMVNTLSQRIREDAGRSGVDLRYGYILNSRTHGTVGERHQITN